jgi:cytochrome b pre-mRNA-processing protein 3
MVPDTLDGRFDLIILHIFIIIKIFKNSSEQNKNFTQKLFDIFMIEVESSYREMGISDQSFSKKMKVVIESFYGRTKMYDLNFDNKNEFINCLVRNIWSEDVSNEIFAGELYDFVIKKVNKYNNKSISEILELSVDGF